MKRILEDIKSGQYKNVYLLYGEEAYLKRVYLKRLLGALGAEPGDMNYTVFADKKTADEDIIGICDTLPFFAEKRTVLLDDCALFKTKHEKLADYMKNLPEYLVMIISEPDTDKRSKLYKEITKAGIAVEFKTLDEKELGSMVAQKLASAGKRIRKNTCAYLLSKTGTDLYYINSELEKLIAYSGDRTEITQQDIDDICSPVIENKVFDLVTAAANGDRKTALQKYDDLILLKESPMRILYLLARQYDQLLRIKELTEEGRSSGAIADVLKMNPYVVQRLVSTSRRYSVQKLREAVEDMVQAEEDVKTGRLDERISVELMLMKYS